MVYGDTDSVVYIHRPGLPDPLIGDYLGDFKDELSNGHYIIEFWGVPKPYSYVTAKGKELCKVHGLSLNSERSLQMNYQVLRQNRLEEGRARPTSPRTITTSVTPNSSTLLRQPAKSRNISWRIKSAWLILLLSKHRCKVMLNTPPKMRKWQNFCVHCKQGCVTTQDTLTFLVVNRFFGIKLLLVVLILVPLAREGTGHNSTHFR